MKGTENLKLRATLKERGVMLWQIADKMHISEPTLTRILRYPLSAEKEAEFLQIADEIAAERGER